MRSDLGHCEALYLRLETALSPGDGLTLLVPSPDQAPVLIAAPLGDTVLSRHVLAVLHHLGVLHLLLALGAPHHLVLGREDPHAAPWFVQHLQPTHGECLHLAVHLSHLHTNLLPPLHTGLDELCLTAAVEIEKLLIKISD